MPNICFHGVHISWSNIFCQFPEHLFDNNTILITLKKDVVFNLSTIQ